jgi:ankyrin repeat protein
VTALHIAVLRGHLPVVALLATAGASLSPGDLVEFTPLHYAAWAGREQIAQYLLSFDLPSLLSSVGDQPLHLAAHRGHVRICKLLVEKGEDVNAKDGEHHTPIHVARYPPPPGHRPARRATPPASPS